MNGRCWGVPGHFGANIVATGSIEVRQGQSLLVWRLAQRQISRVVDWKSGAPVAATNETFGGSELQPA
jgi:hypothetical protein